MASLNEKDIIILAGGLGSRLGELSKLTPKPMQIIADKPFLEYLLNYLLVFKFNRIILSVGHMSESIINYFGNTYKNSKIVYSIEDRPLGTGGAIKKASSLLLSNEFFLLNGDTYMEHDLMKMMAIYKEKKNFVLSAVKVSNSSRYGKLKIINNKLKNFDEKKFSSSGYINAGCYLLNKSILDLFSEEKFSFEKFMMNNLRLLNFDVIKAKKDFIDIGVPDDLQKANKFFEKIITKKKDSNIF